MEADPILIARRLQDAKAHIWVKVDAAGGDKQFRLDPADAADFLADPRSWTAKQWGITGGQLSEWDANNRMPRCGAKAKSGKRCRNRLTSEMDPPRYVELDGDYCHVHA